MNAHELSVLFITGLISAPHCLGMCGGIVSSWTLQERASALATVLAYNAGRITTYMAVGGLMGGVGSFVDAVGAVAGLQGFAAMAGGALILLWVFKKYTLPFARLSPVNLPSVQRLLGALRLQPGLVPVYIGGILFGFIPCGLTYAMHMTAAASGSMLNGVLILAAFGAGTVPALLLAGLLSRMFARFVRQGRPLLIAANTLAVAIGTISIMRGLAANGWVPSVTPWLW